MKIKCFFFLMLLALSLPAVWSIITPGYFPIHDNTQVARVYEMYQALKNHQFPARWAGDLGFGYGYPIFNFYNPLPYYFGALFMFSGLDILIATKIMFTLPIIFSIFSMYVFAKLILNKWGAILAGTLYLYAPYHGVQIFVRGAVAEYWAYAILPLLFWAIWKKKFLISTIFLAVLILSHNLTAFMSIPFILSLIVIKLLTLKTKKSKSLLLTSYFLLLTSALGLSAFFWVPALFQSKLTMVSQMVFQKFDPPALHVIQPLQLWSSPWGYGGSSPGIDDGLSLQLGKIHLLGSFLGILMLLFVIARSLRRGNLDRHATSWLAMTGFGLLFSLFMLLPFSIPVWNSFKFLSYIQFPWRLLTFASLFSSILTSYSIIFFSTLLFCLFGRTLNFRHGENSAGASEPRSRALATHGRSPWEQVSVLLGFSLLFITYSLKFFQPQFKYPSTAAALTSRERLIWEVSLRSYEYLPLNFTIPQNQEVALRVDNLKNHSLINEFRLKTRPLQIFSNIISLTTLISLSGYYFYDQSRKYRRIPG